VSDQARREVRKEVVTRTFIVFVLVGILGTLALLTTLTVQNFQRGKTNRDTLKQLTAQSALIKSCTTPGQPCYARGQSQTADAVGNINRVVILAAACAVGKTGNESHVEAQIQSCVIDGLAKDAGR
jgi:hypothetical protein